MTKFYVEIREIHTQIIEVEAEGRKEARRAAEIVLNTGTNQDGSDLPNETRYDSTVDKEEWLIWK